jgi:hypothetical protein
MVDQSLLDVIPRNLVEKYQRLEGPHYSHLQSRNVSTSSTVIFMVTYLRNSDLVLAVIYETYRLFYSDKSFKREGGNTDPFAVSSSLKFGLG